jgi:uncharacterized protein (TIGR02284 family)
MDRDKLKDKLAHLLSICNDGKEGYQKAAENVEDAYLKGIFLAYANERSTFATELKSLLIQIVGEHDKKEGGPAGFIHRVWMDIKSALSGKDRAAILKACITGDTSALNAYDEVLENEELATHYKMLLNKQRQEIAEALQRMKALEQKESVE